jgi:adenine-specific DNA methylase
MDKADGTAREHIAKTADLIAAIRLPEGSFRAEAGTDVVVDILFFRKRKPAEPEGDRVLARHRRGPTCDRGRGRYPRQSLVRPAS